MAFEKITSLKKVFIFLTAFTLGFLFAIMTLWNTQLVQHQRTPSLGPPPSSSPGQPTNRVEKEDPAVDELLDMLQTRLQTRICYDTACPGHFSSSLRERLQQVLSVRTTIPAPYLQALASAARTVTPHKYIFVTGASSNHYKEMQALLHSVFNTLFPLMKGKDFTLVVYNLGLTPNERRLTEKNCRCTLIDFPFAGLPDFVSHVKCYVWKPLIMASLLEKAEYLVWMDASIRWRDSTPLADMFRQTRASGYLTRHDGGSIAVRSQASMAKFFGDHLCQYAPFGEMATGLIFYYNDRFMREAILHPWLSCAFNRDCICVKNYAEVRGCGRRKPNRYGTCHRYEQSSIGMILSKLFLENRPMLYVPAGAVGVARGDTMDWFKSA